MGDAKVARMQAMVSEAGALIEAGEDASGILMALKLMVDADDDVSTRASEKEKRREVHHALKHKRNELRGQLASCGASLGSAPTALVHPASPKPPSTVASVPPSRGSISSFRPPSTASSVGPPPSTAASSAAPRTLPQLRLKPPVIDPVDIMPPKLIEKFRAEYRAARAKEELIAAASTPSPPPLPRDAKPTSPRKPLHRPATPAASSPTLEDYNVERGFVPPPPGPPPDYRSMLHGQNARATFKAFPGALSVGDEAALSPRGRRRVGGARGAQSTLGSLLAGRADVS